jgi:hypothetical protein
MNRKLLVAPVVLLCLVAGPAAADYIFIRINLDKIALPDGAKIQAAIQQAQQQAQQPQGFGGFGGQPVPGNFQPGMPQRGNPRMQPGRVQQPPRQIQPPRQPVPGRPPAPAQEEPDEFDPLSPWVGAFVEYKLKHIDQGAPVAQFDTHFGTAWIPVHPVLKGSIHFGQVSREPFSAEFAKRLKKLPKDKMKADDLLHLAEWCLSHGLTHEEFVKGNDGERKLMKAPLDRVIEELAKIEPKHVVVKNFARARDLLKKPLTDNDPDYKVFLDEMQKEGYRFKQSQHGHYVMFSNLAPAPQTDAILNRRLWQLEEAYNNFFLWFALQKDLPQPLPPRGRLVTILATSPQEFHSRHMAWGAPSLADDGFTPRRDNIMILSGTVLDEGYQSLAKQMESIYQQLGVSRDDLLRGTIWKSQKEFLQLIGNKLEKAAGIIYATPLTLLLRALEDEVERAAATHEGTRQLLIATGLLPRTVQVPEWVISGIASYFESPVGSPYPGVGLPSSSHLIALKHFRANNRLGKPAEVLFNILTDRYFQTAQQSMAEWQENKDSQKLAHKAQEDSEIARATAWALVYYLVQTRKSSHLLRYGQELNRLPRDLDLDEKALQACFARAFDELADPKDARRLEPARLQQFADEWLGFMQGINLEEDVVEREYLDLRDQKEKAKAPAAAPAQ